MWYYKKKLQWGLPVRLEKLQRGPRVLTRYLDTCKSLNRPHVHTCQSINLLRYLRVRRGRTSFPLCSVYWFEKIICNRQMLRVVGLYIQLVGLYKPIHIFAPYCWHAPCATAGPREYLKWVMSRIRMSHGTHQWDTSLLARSYPIKKIPLISFQFCMRIMRVYFNICREIPVEWSIQISNISTLKRCIASIVPALPVCVDARVDNARKMWQR